MQLCNSTWFFKFVVTSIWGDNGHFAGCIWKGHEMARGPVTCAGAAWNHICCRWVFDPFEAVNLGRAPSLVAFNVTLAILTTWNFGVTHRIRPFDNNCYFISCSQKQEQEIQHIGARIWYPVDILQDQFGGLACTSQSGLGKCIWAILSAQGFAEASNQSHTWISIKFTSVFLAGCPQIRWPVFWEKDSNKMHTISGCISQQCTFLWFAMLTDQCTIL